MTSLLSCGNAHVKIGWEIKRMEKSCRKNDLLEEKKFKLKDSVQNDGVQKLVTDRLNAELDVSGK